MKGPSEGNSKPTFSGRDPVRLGGVLEGLIGSLGLTRRYHGWLVLHRWPEIVGEYNAERTKAYRYDDGTLFVAVENDALRQDLIFMSEKIQAEINDLPYGYAVKEIRFVGGRKGK